MLSTNKIPNVRANALKRRGDEARARANFTVQIFLNVNNNCLMIMAREACKKLLRPPRARLMAGRPAMYYTHVPIK